MTLKNEFHPACHHPSEACPVKAVKLSKVITDSCCICQTTKWDDHLQSIQILTAVLQPKVCFQVQWYLTVHGKQGSGSQGFYWTHPLLRMGDRLHLSVPIQRSSKSRSRKGRQAKMSGWLSAGRAALSATWDTVLWYLNKAATTSLMRATPVSHNLTFKRPPTAIRQSWKTPKAAGQQDTGLKNR